MSKVCGGGGVWGGNSWPRTKTSGPRVCLSSDRAMVHYDCELKAVLGQAVISLKSPEERDNIVAILIITEVRPSLALPCPGFSPLSSGPYGQRIGLPLVPSSIGAP